MSAAHPMRVLLAEDNPGDARLIQLALTESGASVELTHVATLNDGVRLANERRFDAALLDLSLPDSHGLETFRRFHAHVPEVPVVIVTSYGDEKTATTAVGEGAQDYLVKGPETTDHVLLRTLRYAVERQRWQTEYAEMQKRDTVARLSGVLSHEYNNLLTTVVGCSELLLDRVADDRDLLSLAVAIHQAGERAALVTKQVSEIGGHKRLAPRTMNLNDAIRAADGLVREALGDGIELRVDLGASPDLVVFSPAEVDHLLGVLAMHAKEDMPEGGLFHVSTSNVAVDSDVERALGVRPGSHVVVAISNSGAGVHRVTEPHHLEPFLKVRHEHYATSGLALAGLNGTLRGVGGRLFVNSNAGHGTTFTIYLPEAAASSAGQQKER